MCQEMKPQAGSVVGLLLVCDARQAQWAGGQLRSKWAMYCGQRVLERQCEVLRGAGVGRVLVCSAGGEVEGRWGRQADLVVAPGEGFGSALGAGLEVAFGVVRPPEAVLVWPVRWPLADADALEGVLCEPGLGCGPGFWLSAPWSQSRGWGWPVLMSGGLAKEVLASDLKDMWAVARAHGSVIWRRVALGGESAHVDLAGQASLSRFVAGQ